MNTLNEIGMIPIFEWISGIILIAIVILGVLLYPKEVDNSYIVVTSNKSDNNKRLKKSLAILEETRQTVKLNKVKRG